MRSIVKCVLGSAASIALAVPVSAATSDYLLRLDGIGGLPPVLAKLTTIHPTKVEVPDLKVAPRDAASGRATGKRQHKPMMVVGDLDGDGALDFDEASKLDQAPALSFAVPAGSAEEGGLCGKTDHLRTGSLTAPDGTVYDLKTISVVCSGSDGALRTVSLTGSMKHTKTGHVTLIK